MRTIFVASCFLSTVLLNAQTATPGQSATLEARNGSTNALSAFAAAPPATDVSATTGSRRISTGVIAPKLIKESKITVATSDFVTEDLASQFVLLHLLVDESGKPQNVQVIKSANPQVDSRVLAAVRDYRFTPATLDDQAVPLELDLRINFEVR
jgi:TonB family protein